MPRLKSLLVITLLVAPHVRADALSDLKTTLGRLRGSGPIIVTLQLEASRQTREDGADESEQGRVAVEVEDRADGLKISYPRSLLTQADQEMVAKRIDPEKNTPIRTTIQSIGALDASEALNFAPFLLKPARARKLDRLAACIAPWQEGDSTVSDALSVDVEISEKARQEI